MATLSSAIVKAHVASMREVEEALARQVLYGGDLVTNLLELALVSEHLLTPLLAESFGLPPAPHGELARAPDELMSLVPAELAARHSFHPLEETAGILTIAVSEPLPAEVEGDLAFSLGVRIEQWAAPLVRIRQALARDYGVALDRRMLRLVAKLEGHPDPSPSSMPAPLRGGMVGFPKLPRPASVPPMGYSMATGRRASEPGFAPPLAETAAPPPAPQIATLITPRHPSERVEADRPSAPKWLSTPPNRERGRTRHRGPYTAAQAEQDLLDADCRDDVLAAFFDFASQYFEYSALFAVQGDVAEGRDAHGPGADRARLRAIGVPLDLPSALASARNAGAFQLVTLSDDGLDASLAKDLERQASKTVLTLPLVVRGRPVLLLYGDQGDQEVLLSEVGDILAFAPLAAAALERIIMKRKHGGRRASGELSTQISLSDAPRRRRQRQRLPGVEQRVEALARALDANARPSSPPTTAHATTAAKGSPPAGPVTVAASPQAIAGPVTSDESPKALARSHPNESIASLTPPTPAESPQAKGRTSAESIPVPVIAVGRSPRRETPPHGTPGNHEAAQEQPIPLTRRTKSGAPGALAPSLENEATIDAAWDVEADARAAPGPFGELEFEQRSDVGHEAPLAPASRQISLGPRAPFRRQDASDRLLPSVIVDINAECRALLARLLEGDESAGDRLVEIGDPAVSVLVAEFPGPVPQDRARRFAEAGTRASECGPVLHTIVRMGTVAVPFLVVRTADRDSNVRRWATWLLGELPAADAARAVVRRFSDADADVRRGALAAGRLMQTDSEARTTLRDGLATLAAEPSQAPEVRHSSIEALADLRDPRAVPRLIPLLGTDNSAVVRSVHWALATLTRQDFGREGKVWTAWWQTNSGRHRIEWLIDALQQQSLEIRRAASEELKSVSKEYFGYYEDLPAKERERAQRAYREWWEVSGKARFF